MRSPSAAQPRLPHWAVGAGALVLALWVLWAYRGTFTAPFFFDDIPAIVENPSIRHLGSLATVLFPPLHTGSGVEGRPLVNLTLALNYALGGLDVRGYHAANLGCHLLACLLLFGIARRTLARMGRPQAAELGFTIALLWGVHPLLTESVTCVVQRTELLMGLCYQLTLYAFIRGTESGAPARSWLVVSGLACLLGMAAKEVMVTAPLLVLAYDRVFVSGSWAQAWARRRGYYLGLAATWLVLTALLGASGGSRGTVAGFGLGVSSWQYALTQAKAVTHYLTLAFWPHPLVVDYGRGLVAGPREVIGRLVFLALLLGAVAAALLGPGREPAGGKPVGRRALGFLGAWFFVILAPSSSVIPLVSQTIAEHRMYLPLVAVVAATVMALQALIGRLTVIVGLVLGVALAAATASRNEDYRSVRSIWEDTVQQAPDNYWALTNLGVEVARGDPASGEAIALYGRALQLKPHFPEAENNLGIALDAQGDSAAALVHFRAALADRPDYPQALIGRGIALNHLGRRPEALAALEQAVRVGGERAETHFNYAVALEQTPGRLPEAIREYQAALAGNPDYTDAHYDLANALAATAGGGPEAIVHYLAAIRLKPTFVEAHNNLAIAYANAGQTDLAIEQLEVALRLDPGFTQARENLDKLRPARP